MPNHCHNDLWIDGPTEDVDALLAYIGADKPEPTFDFNAIIPYPEHFRALDDEMRALGYKAFRDKHGPDAKDGFNSGGYEWCCANWGTKWGAYEVARRDYHAVGACVTFQTAWSPAPKVIAALHRLFPKTNLHLEYFECGMAICGGVSFLARDCSSLEDEWAAGTEEDAWEGEYRGRRGG